ncbi:hypothetical protein BN14_12244 [Rhizoctonia solani AG-1 IB]|uniref:HAT C-terminal dimerisation domain-containing protein n=1 Tax=Thanatephorus cucumeris (strain AG1-IB / isolate 7/3/14) TaxID=1108050 RepID=M5CFJ2_THACB|nr:hypothetical protein BN14_12244 [Rhizoctonia solani AG-1 IB]
MSSSTPPPSTLGKRTTPDESVRRRVKRHKGINAMTNIEAEKFSDTDILTTSVNAERAFSGGRLMINHLQHQMSPQTFQAQMAIGAWYKTPPLPDLSYATRILEQFI